MNVERENAILVIFFSRGIQSGIHKAQLKDSVWSGLLISAMFMGLISAFLGSALGGGLVSILTLLSSAATMGVFGLLIKKAKLTSLENFAMPVSMIVGMAAAAVYSSIAGGRTI